MDWKATVESNLYKFQDIGELLVEVSIYAAVKVFFNASIFKKLVADSQIQFRDMMVLSNLLT